MKKVNAITGLLPKPYALLVADRSWRRWTLTSALSRLPIAIAPLGLVIAGHYATGSFADGALLAGVYTFAEALAAPWLGRWLDGGQLRGRLAAQLVGGAVVLAVLLGLVVAHAPLISLLAATALAAAVASGAQGGLRTYLSVLVGTRAPAAFALDASLLELEWMSAPALVATVGLIGMPELAVALMLGGSLAAGGALALLPPAELASKDRVGSAWRNRAAGRSYLASGLLGYIEGTVTIALAPLLTAVGSRAAIAGLVLVGLSAASAAGGFGFAALSPRLTARREMQADASACLLGVLAIPVALAPSVAVVASTVAAFGLLIAPMNALRTQLLSDSMPASLRSEAFSILSGAMALGFGISGLQMGALLPSIGVRWAIIASAVVTTGTAGLLALSAHRRPSRPTGSLGRGERPVA